MSDRRRVPENELSDSEDEGDGRRNEHSYRDRDEKTYKERSLMAHDKERPSQTNSAPSAVQSSMALDETALEADDEME